MPIRVRAPELPPFAENLVPDFRRELERGASFTPWEYTAILDAAGLEVVAGVLDRRSAKYLCDNARRERLFAENLC
jgi:hypothetical protein